MITCIFIFAAMTLVAVLVGFICLSDDVRKSRDAVTAAVRGYSEIEQRKLDEIVGRLEFMQVKIDVMQGKLDVMHSEQQLASTSFKRIDDRAKKPGPPVIQDFEASQKATLEEYREQ